MWPARFHSRARVKHEMNAFVFDIEFVPVTDVVVGVVDALPYRYARLIRLGFANTGAPD